MKNVILMIVLLAILGYFIFGWILWRRRRRGTVD